MERNMVPVIYIVKSGDTLGGIALHFYGNGTQPFWRRIYNANQAVIGPDPDSIQPGQPLVIPFPATLPVDYVVKQGDTLSGIALHVYGNGTEPFWRKIYDANQAEIGDDPDHIEPGEELTIPA
jgi:nucleoid-associated protein YgaU